MPAKPSLTDKDKTKNFEIAKILEAKILKAKMLLNNMYALMQATFLKNFWPLNQSITLSYSIKNFISLRNSQTKTIQNSKNVRKS